jgi:O-antigen/teichoic acid export membrane protein
MTGVAVSILLFKLIERAWASCTTMLVQLLSPTDFGIVAIATSFIFIAELLTAFGFAVMQKRDATVVHYAP